MALAAVFASGNRRIPRGFWFDVRTADGIATLAFLILGLALWPIPAFEVWPGQLPPDHPQLHKIGILLVMTLAMTQRRVRPDLAIGLIMLSTLWGLGTGLTFVPLIAMTDVLYAAARYGRTRTRLSLKYGTVLALVSTAIFSLIAGRTLTELLLLELQAMALLLVPLTSGTMIRSRDDLLVAERQTRTVERENAEHERRAILNRHREETARELHDMVANQVSAIALQVEAARMDSGRVRPDPTLDAISDSARLALGHLSNMIEMLRGEERAQNFDPEYYLEGADIRCSVEDRAHIIALLRRSEPEQRHNLERVLSEAIGNARRHGHGKIDISLGAEDELRISNSFSCAAGGQGGTGGTGVPSLRARARDLNRTLYSGPDPRNPERWLCTLGPQHREAIYAIDTHR